MYICIYVYMDICIHVIDSTSIQYWKVTYEYMKPTVYQNTVFNSFSIGTHSVCICIYIVDSTSKYSIRKLHRNTCNTQYIKIQYWIDIYN